MGQQDEVPECAVLSAFAFLQQCTCSCVCLFLFFGVCCSLCVLLFGTEVLDLPEHRPSFCSRCAHRRRLVLVAFFLKHFGAVRCRSNWPEAGADVFPFSQAAQMSSILHRSMNQSTSWIHQGMQKINLFSFIYLSVSLAIYVLSYLSI